MYTILTIQLKCLGIFFTTQPTGIHTIRNITPFLDARSSYRILCVCSTRWWNEKSDIKPRQARHARNGDMFANKGTRVDVCWHRIQSCATAQTQVSSIAVRDGDGKDGPGDLFINSEQERTLHVNHVCFIQNMHTCTHTHTYPHIHGILHPQAKKGYAVCVSDGQL